MKEINKKINKEMMLKPVSFVKQFNQNKNTIKYEWIND